MSIQISEYTIPQPECVAIECWKGSNNDACNNNVPTHWREIRRFEIMVFATESEGHRGFSWASSHIHPCFVVAQQNAKHHSVLDRYDRTTDMSQMQTKPSNLQILFPQSVTLPHSTQDQPLVPNNQQRQHIQEPQIPREPVAAKLIPEQHNLPSNFATPAQVVKPFSGDMP